MGPILNQFRNLYFLFLSVQLFFGNEGKKGNWGMEDLFIWFFFTSGLENKLFI